MSYAAQGIQKEFHLTDIQIGWVLSAFIVGYGLCQIPAGLVIDRFGACFVLTLGLLAWSCGTLLTAFVPFTLLIAIRFATGIAQSAALPCGNKIVSRWMPVSERATGNSVVFTGIGLGGLLAPPVTISLMSSYGWRMPLQGLGLLGLGLAALWRWYGTDKPEQHRGVNRAELELIDADRKLPCEADFVWRSDPALRNSNVWMLVLSYGVAGYPSYVFYTWFYLYIANVRHVKTAALGYWSMLPYLSIVLLTPLGGKLSDLVSNTYGKRLGRTSIGMAGAILAAMLILAGARVEDARLAMVLLALAAGFHLFGQTPAWAATIDLSPSRPATLFGLMNTAAQAAGAMAPVLTPALANRFGWTHALDFAAGMALLAGLLWLGIRPDLPVAV